MGIPVSPRRNWQFHLPALRNREANYTERMDHFFKPQIQGAHELIITKQHRTRPESGEVIHDDYQYAGYGGLSGRPVRQINGWWTQSFYVSSGSEWRILILALVTLLVAICSLLK